MDANIKLIPLNGTPSYWKMSMGPGNEGSDHAHYPKIQAPKDSGAHILTFDIVGKNDITFSKDPIWVWIANPTGTKPTSHSDNPQIPASTVLNNGKQLLVVDWNSDPGTLQYQLNFDSKGTPYHPLDPVIENGGGIKTGAFYSYSTTQVALVGLAAAVIFFFVGGFVQRRFKIFG